MHTKIQILKFKSWILRSLVPAGGECPWLHDVPDNLRRPPRNVQLSFRSGEIQVFTLSPSNTQTRIQLIHTVYRIDLNLQSQHNKKTILPVAPGEKPIQALMVNCTARQVLLVSPLHCLIKYITHWYYTLETIKPVTCTTQSVSQFRTSRQQPQLYINKWYYSVHNSVLRQQSNIDYS